LDEKKKTEDSSSKQLDEVDADDSGKDAATDDLATDILPPGTISSTSQNHSKKPSQDAPPNKDDTIYLGFQEDINESSLSESLLTHDEQFDAAAREQIMKIAKELGVDPEMPGLKYVGADSEEKEKEEVSEDVLFLDDGKAAHKKVGFHERYYAILRDMAFAKISRMLKDMDRMLAIRLIREEEHRDRRKVVTAVATMSAFIAFLALTIVGVLSFESKQWDARFFLKSSWASDRGIVRIIVEAKNLSEKEKFEGLSNIQAKISDLVYDDHFEAEIMPIYLKTGQLLLIIQGKQPISLSGPCELEVTLKSREFMNEKTIMIKNLMYEAATDLPSTGK
jgi:hypothetical protein